MSAQVASGDNFAEGNPAVLKLRGFSSVEQARLYFICFKQKEYGFAAEEGRSPLWLLLCSSRF